MKSGNKKVKLTSGAKNSNAAVMQRVFDGKLVEVKPTPNTKLATRNAKRPR